MKRALVKLAVFLLLGALINAAVAWHAVAHIRSDPRWFFHDYLTIDYTCFGDARATQTTFSVVLLAPLLRGTTAPGRHNSPDSHVVWGGCITSTVLMAALLAAVVLVPLEIRRASRLAAGLCPGCGYDLRGRAATSEVCPECGKPLAKQQAETQKAEMS